MLPLVGLLCLLALALRLYRLEFQSLWWDEGISIYLSGLDLSSLTRAKDFATDLHPPLYHLLLGLWRWAAGPSVFSLRLFSVFCGVLAAPLAFAIGRSVAGRLAGLIAGLLVCLSPFLVFYSQETRMYSLAPLIGLLSLWLAFRILRDELNGRARLALWGAFALVGALGLYSYYYLGLLTLTEYLILGVALLLRPASPEGASRMGGLSRLIGSGLLLALLYLPWLVSLYGLYRSGGAAVALTETLPYPTLAAFLRSTLAAFSYGFSAPILVPPLGAVALACALACLGALSSRKTPPARRIFRVGLLVAVALPAFLSYVIYLIRPFYQPRFVIFSAPAFYILIAFGLAAIPRLLSRSGRALGLVGALTSALALGAILYSFGFSLQAHYTSPRTAYSSSDYRVALETMRAYAMPGDLFLGTIPWQLGYASAYLPESGLKVEMIGSQAPAPAALAEKLKANPRIWVMSSTPDGQPSESALEKSLDSLGRPALADSWGDTRVRLYLGPSMPSPFASQAGPAAPGETIRLVGASLSASGPSAQKNLGQDRERISVRPGQTLDLGLGWLALIDSPRPAGAETTGGYTVFTHVVGPEGKPVAQKDSPPLSGLLPTGSWLAGELVVDRYRLTIPPDAPPGEYAVSVGLYDPKSGRRLDLFDPTGQTGQPKQTTDNVIVGRLSLER